MDLKDLTDDDYIALQKRITVAGGDSRPPKQWLTSALYRKDKDGAILHCVLQLALEDMPLFINHKNDICNIVSKWRLEIGK